MKDLLLYNYNDKKEFHVRDILREAYFTYEYKSISELLVEMRQARSISPSSSMNMEKLPD